MLVRVVGRVLFVLLCIFATDSLKAQTPYPLPTNALQPGVRPPLSPFPRYQDWSFLRDPANRVDPYDRLKFIPLNHSGTSYLTLGLENRTEFQYLNSNDWGAGPQDHTGYMLERLMPDVDIHVGDHARVFITPAFDDVAAEKAEQQDIYIYKDVADGHEGFLELGGNLHAPHPGWDVIIGRQEIVFGTGRLLGNNEGGNIRGAFDGIRIGYDKPEGRIDLIAVKPVAINPGAWDDMPDSGITLWGLYASNLRWKPRFMTDIYFLDYDAKSAQYGNETAREQRRIVGARYFNRLADAPPKAGFDYNVETGYQWGTFGNRQIRAWGAGANFGWTFSGPAWPVRFGLEGDAISGDNGQPRPLGTFNAFFPRGTYFVTKLGLIGPANLLSIQPQFVFQPLRSVSGTLEWISFWRESTKDALYGFGNVPLRPANLSSARFVGSQPNLEIRWAVSEHFLATANIAGFVTGEFLKQSPPSNAILYVNLGLTYRF